MKIKRLQKLFTIVLFCLVTLGCINRQAVVKDPTGKEIPLPECKEYIDKFRNIKFNINILDKYKTSIDISSEYKTSLENIQQHYVLQIQNLCSQAGTYIALGKADEWTCRSERLSNSAIQLEYINRILEGIKNKEDAQNQSAEIKKYTDDYMTRFFKQFDMPCSSPPLPLDKIHEELEIIRKKSDLMHDKQDNISSQLAYAISLLEDGMDFDKGMKALQQGRYEDAAVLLGNYGDKSKKQAAQSYFYQGNAFAGKKDYGHAAEAYERSSLLDSEYSYTWNNWGISLRQLGRYAEAENKYKEAINRKPENTYALFNLANLFADLNRYPEAVENYKMASKIHPQDADIRNNLGISLYNWGNSFFDQGKHEEAINKYKEAVKYLPKDDSIWFNYGLSLFELQRYEEAIQKFQKALEYNPTHDNALYNLRLAEAKRLKVKLLFEVE